MSDIEGGDTMIPCTIKTKNRLRDLKTKAKKYDDQLNEIMDVWEEAEKKR